MEQKERDREAGRQKKIESTRKVSDRKSDLLRLVIQSTVPLNGFPLIKLLKRSLVQISRSSSGSELERSFKIGEKKKNSFGIWNTFLLSPSHSPPPFQYINKYILLLVVPCRRGITAKKHAALATPANKGIKRVFKSMCIVPFTHTRIYLYVIDGPGADQTVFAIETQWMCIFLVLYGWRAFGLVQMESCIYCMYKCQTFLSSSLRIFWMYTKQLGRWVVLIYRSAGLMGGCGG